MLVGQITGAVSVVVVAAALRLMTPRGVAHRGHDRHVEARAAKRTDLALHKVGPFIANLPPEDQEQITVELADRTFVKGDLGEYVGDAGKSLSEWVQTARGRAKVDVAVA